MIALTRLSGDPARVLFGEAVWLSIETSEQGSIRRSSGGKPASSLVVQLALVSLGGKGRRGRTSCSVAK